MAAYLAPAGATESVDALSQPIDAIPPTESTYVPPVSQAPEPAIPMEEEPHVPDGNVGPLNSEPDGGEYLLDLLEGESAASEFVVESLPAPNDVPVTTAGKDVSTLAVDSLSETRTYTYSPPPTPPRSTSSNELSPVPGVYKALPGKNTNEYLNPTLGPGSGRSSSSPQTIILIGIAALLGVCAAAAVASSNSALFLLIGGPIAVSLIAIGVLLLVGRYPTGRP